MRRYTQMTIRPLRPDDVPAVLALDTEAFGDLFERLTGQPANMTVREAAYFHHWRRTDPEGAMVAEEDGQIVGINICHARGRGGWVGPLAVKPNCQSSGIGKALMAAAFDYFDSRGCAWVGLDTYPQNPVSVSLYLKSGMRILQTMFQLELQASQWETDVPREGIDIVDAATCDLAELVAADRGQSDLDRRPDFEFLLGWDQAAVFRMMRSGECIGQVCAYQKRRKGVIGGLLLCEADANHVLALVSRCVEFFKALGLERVVVLCPGDERRVFGPLHLRGAKTIMTTVRLFKGDDAARALAPNRNVIYTPFASEKG